MISSLASMEYRANSHPAVDRLERELAQAKAVIAEQNKTIKHREQLNSEFLTKFTKAKYKCENQAEMLETLASHLRHHCDEQNKAGVSTESARVALAKYDAMREM